MGFRYSVNRVANEYLQTSLDGAFLELRQSGSGVNRKGLGISEWAPSSGFSWKPPAA